MNLFPSGRVQGAKSLKTPFDRLQFGKPAARLLDKVILDAARAFGNRQNAFPVGRAFARSTVCAVSNIL
jgi:hypothetical protein